MARGAGFPVADVDVGLFTDPKMRKLARLCPDEATTARAAVAFVAALLESWGQGERTTVEDAAPLWLTDPAALVKYLVSADLVDSDGHLLDHAWESWFGPALQRRIERQAAGRKGGLAKGSPKRSHSSAKAKPEQRNGSAVPDRPTDPSDPFRSELVTPQPPMNGGRRADGTNARAIAERDQEEARRIEEAKAWRRNQRRLAYNRHSITEAQYADMDRRDAPLEEIPDYRDHRARIAAEVGQ